MEENTILKGSQHFNISLSLRRDSIMNSLVIFSYLLALLKRDGGGGHWNLLHALICGAVWAQTGQESYFNIQSTLMTTVVTVEDADTQVMKLS